MAGKLYVALKYLAPIVVLIFPFSSHSTNSTWLGRGPGRDRHTLTSDRSLDDLDAKGWRQVQAILEAGYPEIAKLVAGDAQTGDTFGVSVAMSSDTVVIGAYPGDPVPLAAGAVYVFKRDLGGPGNWGQAAKLTASDGQAFDLFGNSVAISGNTIVVGAKWEDGGPGDPLPASGAAYVFERDLGGPGNWGEAAKLTASDAQQGDLFGASVAISGNTIVIGARGEDGGPGDPLPGAGAAYIFERDQGGPGMWGETKKLTASIQQDGASFGTSVAMSQDTIVVGATHADSLSQINTGAAFLFERNIGGPGNWGEWRVLTASDAQDDLFGIAVAIDSNTLVVGASFEDGGPGDPHPDSGAAYVFERDFGGPGNWEESSQLRAGDAQDSDYFGSSVGISSDRIVVGAYYEDGGPGDPLPEAGAVYVFERNLGGPGSWQEATKLTTSDAQAYDFFGISLAISGSAFVVGAYWEDGGPGDPLPSAGAAYLFQSNYQVYLPLISRK